MKKIFWLIWLLLVVLAMGCCGKESYPTKLWVNTDMYIIKTDSVNTYSYDVDTKTFTKLN